MIIQYNTDDCKLKGHGNLLPVILGSIYLDFLSGHVDSGKRGSYHRFSHRSIFVYVLYTTYMS